MTISTMDGRLSRLALGALLTTLALALPATAPAAVTLKHCKGASALDASRCGRVVVPLDPSGAIPGTQALAVRTLEPAKGAATGTILALAGGPGQAATPILPRIAATLKGALRQRRLVTFDQRGTGDSGALTCKALTNYGFDTITDGIAACASQLGPRHSLYTTDASVHDLEAVRAALGVERLILMGTSYGTKVAMAYAAAYPQHVERLILDSTVPTEGVDPLERSTIQAIPAMLRSVCRDGACPFTADPVDDLARLLDRVRATPLDTDIRIGGRSVPAPTNETVVLANILATDVDPLMRAHLPAAIHSALEGDGVPLIMLGGLTGASGSTAQDGISYVLNLATRCEDGPQIWPAGTAVEDRQAAVNRVVDALPRDTFAPFRTEIITTLVAGTATCIGWPDSPIVQPAFTAPTMPTLILSGDDDLRTPPSDAHAAAAAIPGSVLLTVPDTGHSVAGADASGCAKRAITAFAAGATVVPCTDPAKRAIPVGAVAPARFADVEPIAGLPVKVGRTLQAVRLTLADANLRLDWGTVTPVGLTGVGLRGGTTTAVTKGEYRGSVVLQAFSYVPGVTLTGRSKPGGITITVGGASAAHGTVTMDARFRLHGTLGGRRVSLRIPKAELDGTAQGVGPASGDAALGLAAWPATSASTTSSSSAPPASPVG